MPYYKDTKNEVYWLDDAAQEPLLPEDCIAISTAEADDLRKPNAARVWESIQDVRDRRKSGGIKVAVGGCDKWFHSDTDSRIQHLGLKDKARDLILAGAAMDDKLTIFDQPVKWKTMDGSFVDISAQIAFDIVAAVGDLDAKLFVIAEAHKAAMQLSADPSSYDFSAGWPKGFGEK